MGEGRVNVVDLDRRAGLLVVSHRQAVGPNRGAKVDHLLQRAKRVTAAIENGTTQEASATASQRLIA